MEASGQLYATGRFASGEILVKGQGGPQSLSARDSDEKISCPRRKSNRGHRVRNRLL
jgi:hypothetical protein